MIAMFLAIAAVAALPSDFPSAPTVTIAQVRANPGRWDGEWVRLEGWINRCSPLDCALVDRPDNQGRRLGFESSQEFDAWMQALLPARVVVVARIDTQCLINVCTDRTPELRQPHMQIIRQNRHPKKD